MADPAACDGPYAGARPGRAATGSAVVERRGPKAAGLALLFVAFGIVGAISLHIAGTDWPPAPELVAAVLAVSFAAVNLGAAGVLLLAQGCGQARPWRDTRRRRALGWWLLAANLGGPALAMAALGSEPAIEAALAASGADVATGAGFMLVAAGAWRAWRRARRHEAWSADEAMARDPRAPLLYLRSFQDDGRSLAAAEHRGWRRWLYDAVRPISAEEVMARSLQRLGPLVAIGKPGEPLPELGAARLYVDHAQWQAVVHALMARAALVVIRLGASPGVHWEIEQALARLPRQRLVLVQLGQVAPAAEVAALLVPVLGQTWPEVPPARQEFRLLLAAAPSHIGHLWWFDGQGAAHELTIVRWPPPWWDALRRRSGARWQVDPVAAAWAEVFRCLGLEPQGPARSRVIAASIAIAVGWTGAHWVYLGRPRRALLYLLLTPVMMASLFAAWFDAVRFLWMERAEFDRRFYGGVGKPADGQQPTRGVAGHA